MKRSAASEPPPLAIAGNVSAATKPPTGIAVCRTPSASPRSFGPNHCMTARPLAAFTLAPAAPARASSVPRTAALGANAAPATHPAQPARPAAMTSLSPNRSAASPQGRSVSVPPTQAAASRTPTPESESPYSSRSVGASTGRPTKRTAALAIAVEPAASTAQR